MFLCVHNYSSDASANKIEVEKYDSSGDEADDNDDTRHRSVKLMNDEDDEDAQSEVGIAALLSNENKTKRPASKKKPSRGNYNPR